MELEDTALMAKLVSGDMIALEAEYRRKCITKLYNRVRGTDCTVADVDAVANLHGIAFAELVAYMEDFRMEERVAPILKFSDLAHMYMVHLEQLGADIEGRICSTRLKIRLLSVFLDLGAHYNGETYSSYSLMILVMVLGRPVVLNAMHLT